MREPRPTDPNLGAPELLKSWHADSWESKDGFRT